MNGVIDVIHQFAFALVVISVFRDRQSWRTLLTVNLVASIAVALLAIANYLELATPFYGSLAERDHPRIGGVLGNATYLGAYSAVNGILAAGFLVQALLAATSRTVRGELSTWVPTLFWLVVAALNFVALSLSGSFGALAGLLGGGAILMAGGFMMARARLRRAALALVVVLGCAVAALVVSLAQSDEPSEHNPLLSRILNANAEDVGTRSRLLAWQAGADGFAARPWLGWGPENFLVVFGRYVTDGFVHLEIHDRAHSKFVEEAVTQGLLGVAGYLAFWAFVFYVVLRVVRKADGSALTREDRLFTLFAGAALASYFLQSQTLFDTTVMNLQYLLLACYIAFVDAEMRRDAAPQRLGIAAWLERGGLPAGALLQRTGAAIVACATLAVAASGLVANKAIWSAAQATAGAVVTKTDQRYQHMERSRAFRPLANESRLLFFSALTNNWRMLRMRQSTKARQLLAQADAEADAAVAAEPENWLLHHYLAQLYRQVANTEPRYQARAKHHWERTYELAPYQHTFIAGVHSGQPLPPPPHLQQSPPINEGHPSNEGHQGNEER